VGGAYISKSLLFATCGRMVKLIYGSLSLFPSENWTECQAAVDNILRGFFPTSTKGNFASVNPRFMLLMKDMAYHEHHNVVKARGRRKFKGFNREKHKHKEWESASIRYHYGSRSRPNDQDNVKETLEALGNCDFNGEYIEIYSISLLG